MVGTNPTAGSAARAGELRAVRTTFIGSSLAGKQRTEMAGRVCTLTVT